MLFETVCLDVREDWCLSGGASASQCPRLAERCDKTSLNHLMLSHLPITQFSTVLSKSYTLLFSKCKWRLGCKKKKL